MALELVYTSAERGLRAGTSGFCTVAMTRGLPPALVPRLEALGGYRPGPSGNGPRAHCFWRVETAGSVAHVLAVVGPAPPDHTQRTNKIAAYLVLGQDELVPAGPAWLLSQRGVLRDGWSGAPAWIEAPVRVPASGPSGPRRCTAWESAAGDAGWAGVVASAFLRDQSKPIHVVWQDGMEPLALVGEVLSLMPDWARWRATFSTYFLQPVAGTPCALRFCLAGTPAADAAHQSKGLVVDLTRPLGAAADSRFSRMARSGIDEEAVARDAERARRAAERKASAREGASAARAAEEIGLEPAEELPQEQAARTVRARVDEEAIDEDVDDRPRVDAMRLRITITAITGVLLILVLGAVIYAVTAYRGMIGSSISEVTGGPKLPPIEMPATTEPRAGEPPAVPEATKAEQPSAHEPAPAPVPDPPATPEPPASEPPSAPAPVEPEQPAPELTPDPAAQPAASEPSVSTAQPNEPVALPDEAPTQALPAGLVGSRWALKREATVGGAKAPLRWSGEISVARGARVDFRVPEALAALGVQADGADLTIAGSDFRATSSVDGRDVVAMVESRGTMPEALAQALAQPPGADTVEAWSALMGVVTIEVSDAAGMPLGLAQCRVAARGRALEPGASAAEAAAAPALTFIAQIFVDSAPPAQRRVIAQCLLEPGAVRFLAPTALLTVRLDRESKHGVLSAGVSVLGAAEVDVRSAELMNEHARVRALRRQVEDHLGRSVSSADLDSKQVDALDAAWNELSPEERASISRNSRGARPHTQEAIRAVHDTLRPRLLALENSLQSELAELRPKEDLRSMVLRVSTPEGAIILERSLSLGLRK